MAENLRAVVAEILAQRQPPLAAMIDGDLALTDGQDGDYHTLLQLVDPLRAARIPLYLGLGNHDDRAHFRNVLNVEPRADTEVVDKQVGVVDGPDLRLVILDSLDRVNVTPGVLGERQLRWLAQVLDAGTKTPTLVFVHHNLADAPSALLAVLASRRQVKVVLFGHTHTWARSRHDGLHLVNLPAVAYPFADDQRLGWCRFSPTAEGAEIVFHRLGEERTDDRPVARLKWR
jgi:3',5'-cyclic AMP phosphodiesterase CpdA